MKRVMTIIPVLASVVLAMFFVVLSNFNFNYQAHAESGNTEASLEIDSIINISAPPTVTINCTPGATEAAAQLCTSNANIVVTTNNALGYTLQMNITNDSSARLANAAVSPNAYIYALHPNNSYALVDFPADRWGYTGGLDKSNETDGLDCALNYCRVLETQLSDMPNHVIKETDAPSNASTTTITFGAKVTTAKPSGVYSTSVTFTAMANEPPYNGIEDGMFMQEIDSATCAATPLYSDSGKEYTVFDERETIYEIHSAEIIAMGYTVAKLEDGNCWMTQNLFLGGSDSITLTPNDTNIASNFTLPAGATGGESWDSDPGAPEFFDYVDNNASQQISNKYGNYYNWVAATAGSGGNNGDAQYSICPKNWRLPSAGTAATTGNEFYSMLNNYIITGVWDDSDPDVPNWSGVTSTNLTNTPVSIVLSGGCYYGDLVDQGNHAYLWSSTVNNNDNSYAHTLHIEDYSGYGYDVYPREYNDRGNGASVRCFVPGV